MTDETFISNLELLITTKFGKDMKAAIISMFQYQQDKMDYLLNQITMIQR